MNIPDFIYSTFNDSNDFTANYIIVVANYIIDAEYNLNVYDNLSFCIIFFFENFVKSFI